MKRFTYVFTLLLLFLAAALSFGQTTAVHTATQSSLPAAIANARQNTIYPSSVTAYVPGYVLYVDREAMVISSANATTKAVTLQRGQHGTSAVAHASGAMTLIGPPQVFQTYDPSGACSAPVLASPWVNIRTGEQWLCSTISGTWVPGWNNAEPSLPTTAVASAAGLVTPSGPLFHITGALAITGFNIPLGFARGEICVIPDGAFTTTTANNIAIASTGVVGKRLCWAYDPATTKFYPSY